MAGLALDFIMVHETILTTFYIFIEVTLLCPSVRNNLKAKPFAA